MTLEGYSQLSELKMKVNHWQRNIESLGRGATRVKRPEQAEFDRLLDFLLVRLNFLNEALEKLQEGGDINRQTRSTIQKAHHDMEEAFIRAMSKMN